MTQTPLVEDIQDYARNIVDSVLAAALSLELVTPITVGFDALVFEAARLIEDIYELTFIRKDGICFPAVVSITALCDDRNAIIGDLFIGTDNTARKQVEAEYSAAASGKNTVTFEVN